jgi:hypothetical protein
MKSLLENISFAFAKNIEEWLLDSCENVAALVCSLAFLFFVFRFVVQSILTDLDKHFFDIPTIIAMLGIAFVPELLLVKTLYEYRELRQLENVAFWKKLYLVNAVNFGLITMVTVVQLIAPIFDIVLPAFVGAFALGYRIVSVIFFVVSTRLFEKENGVGFSKKIEELNAQYSEKIEELTAQYTEKLHYKECIVAELNAQIEKLKEQNRTFSLVIHEKNQAIEKAKFDFSELQNKEMQARKQASQAISNDHFSWLSEQKSVFIEEAISRFSVSKNRIMTAIKKGDLQTTTRNKERIVAESLMEWLKEKPELRLVNE